MRQDNVILTAVVAAAFEYWRVTWDQSQRTWQTMSTMSSELSLLSEIAGQTATESFFSCLYHSLQPLHARPYEAAAALAVEGNHLKHHRTTTHTRPFNGPFSGTTRVRRHQKGKTNLDFTEARDSEWQWHQLGHMQVSMHLAPAT